MATLFETIYPVHRYVTATWIIQQAKDELATKYMHEHPEADDSAVEENSRVRSVTEAMDILNDAGTVTFTDAARDLAEAL